LFDFLRSKSFKEHKGEITALAIAPDGSHAVTGAHSHQLLDRNAIVWRLPELEFVRHLKGHRVAIYSAACSPDSKVSATGGGGAVKGTRWIYDNAIRIWHERGAAGKVFGNDLFFVRALSFSPDGRALLSGSSNDAPAAPVRNGASLRLWDWSTGREIARFGNHRSSVDSVAFSPDGTRLVAGSGGMIAGGTVSGDVEEKKRLGLEGRTLRMWDVSSQQEIDAFASWGWVNSVAFHPSGNYLFSCGRGATWWDCNTGNSVARFLQDSFINAASLSADGTLLALGTGGQMEPGAPYDDCFVRICDSMTGARIEEFQHRYPVKALAFAPDGKHVLAGGAFGELHYWELPKQGAQKLIQ
jgi:WD40 repeat protein